MILKQQCKYFIAGSHYYVTTAVDKIKSQYEDIEEHSYFADEVELDDFFYTLYTPSIFNESKFIVYNNADRLTKDKLELFTKNLKQTTSAHLIITANDIKKAESLNKLLTGFEARFEGKQSPDQLAKEIVEIFNTAGIKIDANTAYTMGESTQWDIERLVQEADKLSLYYNGKEGISGAELLSHIYGEPQESLFRFIDKFIGRDSGECLKIYSQLADIKNSAPQIISMLLMYTAGLYFKLNVPELYNVKNPLFNGKNYFMRTVDANFRKWKPEHVSKLIEQFALLDLDIKTGKIDQQDALLVLIRYI